MNEAHIDMSNQIDNSWSKDTALAVVQSNLKYSVLIDVPKKNEIRKFCDSKTESKKNKKAKENKREKKRTKKYFNRAVSITHAYLIYKILSDNKDSLIKVKICKDTIPKHAEHFLQKIKNQKDSNDKLKHINIRFGLKKNNDAQKYAKKVAQGDIHPSYILTKKDVEEIIFYINAFVTLN